MGTHGTDQDMVQRMLTAKDIRRSRRSLILSGLADIPIVFTFLSIGSCSGFTIKRIPIQHLSKTPNETFCHFILYEMPVGLRGLLIAGIFATAMGSLSTALNALATSFTRDWYEPYINPGATDGAKPARGAVGDRLVFGSDDRRRIDHFVSRYCPSERSNHSRSCSAFSATPTARCSVYFSAGMLTKTRGNDRGNVLAMIIGFLVVAILSGLPNDIAGIFGSEVLHPARLVAGNGIPVVDLFRNDRHLCSGGTVPRRTAPISSPASLIPKSRSCRASTSAGRMRHRDPGRDCFSETPSLRECFLRRKSASPIDRDPWRCRRAAARRVGTREANARNRSADLPRSRPGQQTSSPAIRFVNPNAAAADLNAIQNDVVGLGPHFAEFAARRAMGRLPSFGR